MKKKDVKQSLTPLAISNYVKSVEDLAKWWYYIHDPEACTDISKELVQSIMRIDRVGVNYFNPLILSCLYSKEPDDKKNMLLENIEKFIFIYFRLMQNNATLYRNRFYAHASSLYDGSETIDDVNNDLEELINSNKGMALDRFETYIESRFNNNGKGYYNWSRPLKYLLFEYETSLMGKGEKKIHWDKFVCNYRDRKVSIEHIYPQHPEDNWPDWKQIYNLSDDQINRLTHSLGNILALETRINSMLQNYSFEDKKNGKAERPGYRNGSHSERDIYDNYPEWTPRTICNRGIDMLDFMAGKWGLKFKDDKQKLEILGIPFME